MTRSRCLVLLAVMILATAVCSWGQVVISVRFGPPVLPVYAQPICPGPGYIWVPGYWAWSPDADGYYWVPGTWALAPEPGFLWTPGYWGFSEGLYFWHTGYWGPSVGFYGGIDYGYGYPGSGYYGGYWHDRHFYYNRAVNNVNVTDVHYVYNRTVVNNVNVTRVAYTGGPGGIQARPTSEQIAAERQRHMGATEAQQRLAEAARNDRTQLASANHGHPVVAATPRPDAFTARHPVEPNHPAANRPEPSPRVSGANTTRPEPQPSGHNNNQQARTPQNVPRPPENNQRRARLGMFHTRIPARNQHRTLIPMGMNLLVRRMTLHTRMFRARTTMRTRPRIRILMSTRLRRHTRKRHNTLRLRDQLLRYTTLRARKWHNGRRRRRDLSRSSRRGRQTIRLVRLHRRTTLLRIRRRT